MRTNYTAVRIILGMIDRIVVTRPRLREVLKIIWGAERFCTGGHERLLSVESPQKNPLTAPRGDTR